MLKLDFVTIEDSPKVEQLNSSHSITKKEQPEFYSYFGTVGIIALVPLYYNQSKLA